MEKEIEKKSNLKNVAVTVLKVATYTTAAAVGTIIGSVIYSKMKS